MSSDDVSSSLALALANLDGPRPEDFSRAWRSYIDEAGDDPFRVVMRDTSDIISRLGNLSLGAV